MCYIKSIEGNFVSFSTPLCEVTADVSNKIIIVLNTRENSGYLFHVDDKLKVEKLSGDESTIVRELDVPILPELGVSNRPVMLLTYYTSRRTMRFPKPLALTALPTGSTVAVIAVYENEAKAFVPHIKEQNKVLTDAYIQMLRGADADSVRVLTKQILLSYCRPKDRVDALAFSTASPDVFRAEQVGRSGQTSARVLGLPA